MTGKIRIVLGKNLKRLREQAGKSQRELDAETGIDYAEISRMENGKVNVSIDTIEKLAIALNAAFNEFLRE